MFESRYAHPDSHPSVSHVVSLPGPRLARALGRAVVATALLGSLMGYATITGNSDTVEWPTGVTQR